MLDCFMWSLIFFLKIGKKGRYYIMQIYGHVISSDFTC